MRVLAIILRIIPVYPCDVMLVITLDKEVDFRDINFMNEGHTASGRHRRSRTRVLEPALCALCHQDRPVLPPRESCVRRLIQF